MTEDEAKKKWCPYCADSREIGVISRMMAVLGESMATRTAAITAIADKVEGAQKCCASTCMMWQSDTGTCGLAKIKEA